jgi:hypothetical protein
VGTPGGLTMEFYLLLDAVRRIGQYAGNQAVTTDSNVVRNILKILCDVWGANDFKFEIGYLPGLEEALQARKADLFTEDVDLSNINNIFDIVEKLKADDIVQGAVVDN